MNRNNSLTKKVSISLPMELYEQIKTLSEESQRTTSAYIRQVLRVYLQYYAEHAEEAESDHFDRQMSSEKVMPDGYKQAGVHIASIGGRAG